MELCELLQKLRPRGCVTSGKPLTCSVPQVVLRAERKYVPLFVHPCSWLMSSQEVPAPMPVFVGLLRRLAKAHGSSAVASCSQVRGSQGVLLMSWFKRVRCFAHMRCCS